MNKEVQDDLQNRILHLLDGNLDKEAVSHLDEELRESHEARKLYIQLSTLHSALEEEGSAHSSNELEPVIPIERLLARQRRRIITNTLWASAAILILSFVILWFKMVPDSAPVAKFQLSSDSAFTLSHANEEEGPEGSVLITGSRLQLTKGVMEATFASGVRCVIKSPCDLTVLADDRISITEGLAWFHVPPASVGFTVELPQMTVTDLGTEFGVSAPTQKSHEVHVMDGRVRVEAKKASSHPIELNAGEARKVGLTGNLIEIPMHPEKFMSTLPQRSSRLVVNGDLNTAVNRNDDASGKTAFRLNPLTFGILANNTETDIHIDEWIWSGLTRGFTYSENGGETGKSGAFVSNNVESTYATLRPRAVAQFTRDLKATKGSRSLRMDVLLDDNSDRGQLTFIVELYAWNSDQTGPELSMGGPRPNHPTYHVTDLNDATTILSTQVPASSVSDNTWETVDLGSVKLADGYDFYAWRIGILSATVNDRFSFDNVRIAY